MPTGKLKPTSCYVCGQKIDPRGLRTHIKHKHPSVYLQRGTQPTNIEKQIEKQVSLEELFKQRNEYKDKLASIEITITKKLNQMGLSFKPPTEIEQHIGSEDFYGIDDNDINEGSNE